MVESGDRERDRTATGATDEGQSEAAGAPLPDVGELQEGGTEADDTLLRDVDDDGNPETTE